MIIIKIGFLNGTTNFINTLQSKKAKEGDSVCKILKICSLWSKACEGRPLNDFSDKILKTNLG